jgi:hypothetical protein
MEKQSIAKEIQSGYSTPRSLQIFLLTNSFNSGVTGIVDLDFVIS